MVKEGQKSTKVKIEENHFLEFSDQHFLFKISISAFISIIESFLSFKFFYFYQYSHKFISYTKCQNKYSHHNALELDIGHLNLF
jgi:hypothetical protein